MRKHIRKQSEDSQHSNGSRSRKQSKLWSVEDDQQLNQLYGECNGNWKQIAEKMNQRNASQCCQRWKKINPNRVSYLYRLTSQSKVRKQWNDEEDKRLVEYVQQYGKNWKRIEFEMAGRTSKQIRERFINQLDPAINHNKFTEQEDRVIYHLYMQYGPRWSDISKNLKGRPVTFRHPTPPRRTWSKIDSTPTSREPT